MASGVKETKYVYITQSNEGGDLKVGGTDRTPNDRRSELQVAVSSGLHVVGYIENGREKEIHEKFADLWTHGEHFRAVEPLLSWLKENCVKFCGAQRPVIGSTIDEHSFRKILSDQKAKVKKRILDQQIRDMEIVCRGILGALSIDELRDINVVYNKTNSLYTQGFGKLRIRNIRDQVLASKDPDHAQSMKDSKAVKLDKKRQTETNKALNKATTEQLIASLQQRGYDPGVLAVDDAPVINIDVPYLDDLPVGCTQYTAQLVMA